MCKNNVQEKMFAWKFRPQTSEREEQKRSEDSDEFSSEGKIMMVLFQPAVTQTRQSWASQVLKFWEAQLIQQVINTGLSRHLNTQHIQSELNWHQHFISNLFKHLSTDSKQTELQIISAYYFIIYSTHTHVQCS